jgi:hypothetical protein
MTPTPDTTNAIQSNWQGIVPRRNESFLNGLALRKLAFCELRLDSSFACIFWKPRAFTRAAIIWSPAMTNRERINTGTDKRYLRLDKGDHKR